jgi:hypothetical protein
MASSSRENQVSNPLRILETLDDHLGQVADLTLFGRSAIALGFPTAPSKFHSTQDVDGILPLSWLKPSETHEDFWRAVQETNAELEPEGLYLTHLFRELDVILQPDWIQRRVSIQHSFEKLSIYRPATIDLILTKMARGDDDDLDDIAFLLRQESLRADDLREAFDRARVPDVPEIRELFARTQPKVIALVSA